jgi:hypothetical protein
MTNLKVNIPTAAAATSPIFSSGVPWQLCLFVFWLLRRWPRLVCWDLFRLLTALQLPVRPLRLLWLCLPGLLISPTRDITCSTAASAAALVAILSVF